MLNGGFLVLFVLLCCKHKPYNLAHAVMFGSGDREQQCLPDCRGWGSGDGQHCGDSWRGRPDRGCLWHQHPSWGKHLRVAPRLQSGWTGLHGEQRRWWWWWWWRCQLVWVAVFVSPIFSPNSSHNDGVKACNTHAIHFGDVCACAAKLQVNFPASCHLWLIATVHWNPPSITTWYHWHKQ